jgi:A/G-specific adenine glycosylase
MKKSYQEIFTKIADFYKKEGRALPWRRNNDPYRIWLSEIMLQQTRVEAVIPYYNRFLERFPTVRDLAECEEDALLKEWEGLGYYSRARNLHRAARTVCEQYGGVFPNSYEALLALPGVGEYTAGAIGSIAFGLPTAAVDGNVLRIYARLFADERDVTDARVKRDITKELCAVYPAGKVAGELTQGFMEIGQRFCLPNGAPLCRACPLFSLCRVGQDGGHESIPCRAPKKPRKILSKTVLLLHVTDGSGSRFLLRKRPKDGLLGGLWEFPNVDGTLTEEDAMRAAEQLGAQPIGALKTADAKHIFTHLEWHMTGMFVECLTVPEGESTRLASAEEIQSVYPIASAFRVFKDFILMKSPL